MTHEHRPDADYADRDAAIAINTWKRARSS
jgi:hypothetical protein